MKFIKEHEVTRLLSSLGIKTPLSKIHLVGPPFKLKVLLSTLNIILSMALHFLGLPLF